MKINVVNYESGINIGILSKFAIKTTENLIDLGHDARISAVPAQDYDVNLHINYLPYKHENSPNTINALMVTHIWEGYKLDALRKGMQTADIGICMSNDTLEQLVKWGIPREKLAVVLPAHDGHIPRHKIVSILTNVYPDGCKREQMFTELAKTLDNNKWAFRIMGSGWNDLLVTLVANGLQVDYFASFNYDLHKQILESSDYSLYFGVDEGSMGLLDAKNAGLKLIAPNVGFNIDVGVDYPYETQEQLNSIFIELGKNPVEGWTWKKYAEEHVLLFKECITKKK